MAMTAKVKATAEDECPACSSYVLTKCWQHCGWNIPRTRVMRAADGKYTIHGDGIPLPHPYGTLDARETYAYLMRCRLEGAAVSNVVLAHFRELLTTD